MKVEGLKLPILQTLFIFQLFSIILHLKHIKHNPWDIFSILMRFWVFLNVFAVQIDQKWWVFEHSSIPHTKLLLVPSNLLWKFNGFEVSLPKAITSGVAKCFSSSKNYGTLITIWFLANHKLSTDLICLYQKPFASRLANSLMEYSHHLGDLITNYGFPLPLPQAITLRASQLFYFLGYGELNTIQFWANCQP